MKRSPGKSEHRRHRHGSSSSSKRRNTSVPCQSGMTCPKIGTINCSRCDTLCCAMHTRQSGDRLYCIDCSRSKPCASCGSKSKKKDGAIRFPTKKCTNCNEIVCLGALCSNGRTELGGGSFLCRNCMNILSQSPHSEMSGTFRRDRSPPIRDSEFWEVFDSPEEAASASVYRVTKLEEVVKKDEDEK